MAERGGFEPLPANQQRPDLQGNDSKNAKLIPLTASQNSVKGSPELSEIFQSWPKLPANVRLAILTLIRASLSSTK
jgi:hypothetical protein